MSTHVERWPEDAVVRLKALWIEGAPASRIAAMLFKEYGFRASRNAVIGKVHRLGLFRNDASGVRDVAKAAPRPKAPPRIKLTAAPPAPKPIPAAQDFDPDPNGVPIVVRLFDPQPASQPTERLTRHVCRWPVGDAVGADQLFCCRATSPGQRWCDEHRALGVLPRRPAQLLDARGRIPKWAKG